MLSVRPLLPDQVPLRAAPRVGGRLSTPDAARQGDPIPEGRAQAQPQAAQQHQNAGRGRQPSGGQLRAQCRQPQQGGAQGDGEDDGPASRRPPARFSFRHAAPAGEEARASAVPGTGGWSDPRQGRLVRDLLLQRQHARRRPGSDPRVRAQRHPGAPDREGGMLRHAQARAGRPGNGRQVPQNEHPGTGAAHRRRMGHRGRHSVVRADVQAGTAADVPGRRGRAEGQGAHVRPVRIPGAPAQGRPAQYRIQAAAGQGCLAGAVPSARAEHRA